MNHAELLGLRPEAEAALMRYPGVVSIGLGFKERDGRFTDDVAFLVFVDRKRPLSELAPEDVIPTSFKNVPTDVLEPIKNLPGVDPEPCADRRQHGTLVGGITITTLDPAHPAIGTLGFFATFSGVDPPYNIALVTNHHVVTYAGGSVGSTMYQPAWGLDAAGVLVPQLDKAAEVGTVLSLPDMKNVNGFYVDAASVQLAISISSWCHTNCGVKFGNGSEILGLNVNGSNRIADVGPNPANGDTVYKVGRTTGRTVGKVVRSDVTIVNPDGTGGDNNIQVQAVSMQTPDNCGGTLRFFDEGDSGSALIDSQGRLVGLCHGSAAPAGHPELAQASQLQPVLTALGVVPITTANPVHGNPAAVGMRGDALAFVEGRPDESEVLRARFLACDEGRRIAALVDRHRREVVELVNRNRRVTVAWQRGKGPAYLNRAMNNARDPERPIPREIEGVSREALLLGMERALVEHGSEELRVAMAEHRDEVLAYSEEFDSLHDAVDELEGAVR